MFLLTYASISTRLLFRKQGLYQQANFCCARLSKGRKDGVKTGPAATNYSQFLAPIRSELPQGLSRLKMQSGNLNGIYVKHSAAQDIQR